MSNIDERTGNPKIVIHLCASEYGSDTRDYREAGYDVRLITKDIGVENYHPPENVYGIFANPPCQKFSMANPKERSIRDFGEGMRLVKECLRIIWEVQEKGAPLAFWAIENPRGYLERFLGRPVLQFQNWQFGEDGPLATKRTWLWGYFNIPIPSITQREVGYIHDGSRRKQRNMLFPNVPRNKEFLKMSSDERSIASPYFTKAFFLVNP